MKRALLTLAAAMLIGACAPSVQEAPPVIPRDVAERSVADPATLTLTRSEGHQVLTFAAGPSDVHGVRLAVFGTFLRVNAPESCVAVDTHIECRLATVTAGRRFVLPLTGDSVMAVALYTRDALNYGKTTR